MPIVQISWDKIKDRLGDVTAIYALTHRQAVLLLSLTEQLSWDKTFRPNEYDAEEQDELDIEIDDLRLNLAMPVNITDIIGYIDDIEQLLRAIRDRDACCGNTVPIPQPPYESEDIEEFPDGTPPATWGDNETVDDLDDWKDLVCGAAHDWIDLIKTTNEELDEVLSIGVAGVGFVAGLLGAAVTVGIGAPIAYALAVAITSNLIALGTTVIFEETPEDIEAARADIICAIMSGVGAEAIADAVEEAVGAATWLVWYQFLDYDNIYSVLLDGTNGDGTLSTNRGQDCDCDTGPQQLIVNPTLETPVTPWTVNTSDWTLHAVYDGEICLRATSSKSDIPYTSLRSNTFQVNPSYPVVQPSFRIHKYAARTWTPYCRIYRSSDDAIVGTAIAGSFAQGVWDTQDTTTTIDCTGYTGIDLYSEVRMMYTPTTAAFSYLGAMWIDEIE